jgi:branched-chain amino acid transport system permease protein
MAVLRSWSPFLIAIALAIVLQLLVRPLVGPFYAKLLLDMGTNMILAVSLTLVNGFTGQFSMGHAAFMLVGAYAAAFVVYYGSMLGFGDANMAGGLFSSMRERDAFPALFTWGDLLFVSSLIVGGLIAAGAGYVVGLPSLRLKGDYLAIVTLGFGEIMRVVVQALLNEDVLYTAQEVKETPFYKLPLHVGGSLGFSGLPLYTSLFWVFAVAGITIAIAIRLKNSTFGRAFLSIREDEIASEAMGVNTTRYKVRAFVIGAFFAGVAGGLFAHTSGVQLNPGELGFMKSFDIIIMVVLGGLGSISGAAIAAVILTILPEWLRDPGHVWYFGVVAAIVFGLIAKRKARAIAIMAGVTIALEGLRWLAKSNDIDLGRYRMVLYALMLILMMLLRPKGLLGVREIWDAALWRDIAWPWKKSVSDSGKGGKP